MRYLWMAVMSTVLMLPLAACQAEQAEIEYQAGKHYEVLPDPVPTTNPDKIEVVEVFWYGCGHCFTFEPLVHEWQQGLTEEANFVGVPAIWAPAMELHARAYYTANALKVLEQLHKPLFEAMNLAKKKLQSEAEIAEIFVANGVPADKFSKTFSSWGVSQQVKLSQSRQRGYRTQGTPEMVVNGKYRVSSRHAGSQEGMLKVVDYLVAKEQQAAK